MNKAVTLALSLVLLLTVAVGCQKGTDEKLPGAAQTSLVDANPNKTQENLSDEMKIPYAIDLSPEDGADSVERDGDHANSPYFAHPDVYNMESTDTLTVLSNYRTMQQSSEWACGVTAVLMALDWYDALGDWNEETLADLRHPLTGDMEGYPGTTLKQAMDIFDGVGNFTYTTSLDQPEIWFEDIKGWLEEGKPVLVCWNDWGGHWQTIIGYDDMGTDTEQDDVFLVSDSYDTTDHNQDGYGILMAERFMYNFSMYGAFPEEEGGNDMLYLVPTPVG